MGLIEIQTLLKETIGMDPVSVGKSSIESAVRLRMTKLGLPAIDDYGERLIASQEELRELIETVVVPETWFFRDPEAFGILTRLTAEEWLPRHPTEPLRLLSVPCSTGEEPYSMVMALLDAGFPRDRICVRAVDISEPVLVRARRGIYGSNSFRSSDLSFRDRYFRKSGEAHALVDWLPGMVTFSRHNILSPDGVPQGPFDVIFCRNLLIYFDRPTQQQVMATLGQMLLPDGLLFVGPAETFLASSCGFAPVDQAMSFAFRKKDSPRPEMKRPPQKSLRSAVPKRIAAPPPRRSTVRPAPSTSAARSVPATSELETIRHMADAGRCQQALELCERYLKSNEPSSEGYYLLGLLLDMTGDRDRASDCYRKALYLEPKHLEALVHLALLTEAAGDLETAGRLRERARRIETGSKGRAVE